MTVFLGYSHAFKHGLDPLAALNAEDDKKRVREIDKMPSRQVNARRIVHLLPVVEKLEIIVAKELHSDHGEDEKHDEKHERQVAQVAQTAADDPNQFVQRRPALRQLQNAQKTKSAQDGNVGLELLEHNL